MFKESKFFVSENKTHTDLLIPMFFYKGNFFRTSPRGEVRRR